MNSRRPRPGGFTLLEVLVALALVAIAVFPAIQVVQEGLKSSYDAKFATLCAGKMRSLLSEITRAAKPGSSDGGDFSSMTKEEGFDQRFAFADLKWEWQCKSMDLSLDVTPAADQTEEEKNAAADKKKKADKTKEDAEADAAIDERYRARYVRMKCTYHLEDGEEREIVVETYLPPLPTEEQLKKKAGRDLVPPNDGSGASGGGKKG